MQPRDCSCALLCVVMFSHSHATYISKMPNSQLRKRTPVRHKHIKQQLESSTRDSRFAIKMSYLYDFCKRVCERRTRTSRVSWEGMAPTLLGGVEGSKCGKCGVCSTERNQWNEKKNNLT